MNAPFYKASVRPACKTLERLERWDSNKTIQELMEMFGMSYPGIQKLKFRYRLKCKNNECGPKIKPLLKDKL